LLEVFQLIALYFIAISSKIYVFLLHILCLIFQLKSAKYIRYSLILIKKLIHKIFCINTQILDEIAITFLCLRLSIVPPLRAGEGREMGASRRAIYF